MGALLKVILHLCSLNNNVQLLILVYLFSIHCSFWYLMKVNMWHYVWSKNSRDCISPMSKIFSEAHLSFSIFCGTRWTNEPQKLLNNLFLLKKIQPSCWGSGPPGGPSLKGTSSLQRHSSQSTPACARSSPFSVQMIYCFELFNPSSGEIAVKGMVLSSASLFSHASCNYGSHYAPRRYDMSSNAASSIVLGVSMNN